MDDADLQTLTGPSSQSADALRRRINAVEPKALLVDPWIMRRVIRMDRRLTGLGFHVPHRHVYTIERERLLAYVDRPELELAPATELPPVVILLSKPTEDEAIERPSMEDLLRRYWRLLFHARVHLEMEQRYPDRQPPKYLPAQRRMQLGEVEFAEIRSVLSQEDLLFPEPSDWETYVEFAATYLELRYFQPDDLSTYFPSIRDWELVGRIISQDVYHAELYESVRPLKSLTAIAAELPDDEASAPSEAPEWREEDDGPSPTRTRKWQQRAARAEGLGNRARAAIFWQRTADAAAPSQQEPFQNSALRQLTGLVHSLRDVLRLTDDEVQSWIQGLRPLLKLASRSIWSADARLLFDLQKVCLEYESSPIRTTIVRWLFSGFRHPWRRPLPLLREVLLTKHLRSAERRLVKSQLGAADRGRISQLLSTAVEHLEHDLRRTLRPRINQVLDEVGLEPRNVPERVARTKLVEELLDQVVEHGYLNTGIFRDALSKSDLKLPDVAGLGELWSGDILLRADRRMSQVLDGVYRPAAIYLRWSQRLSSVAFGTPLGRSLTLYFAIPFGGAFLIIEGLQHMVGWFTQSHPISIPDNYTEALQREAIAAAAAAKHAEATRAWFYPAVLVLGILILLLMHHRGFRDWFVGVLTQLAVWSRRVLIELPMSLLRIPLIEQILHSPAYATLRSYLLKPFLLTGLTWAVLYQFFDHWSARTTFELFLVFSLFLNSPVGRYADEWLTDVILRSWEELRVRVIAAFFHWVMDVFHRLMTGLDRLMFALDEWTRFRARDNPVMKVFKLIGGGIWSIVSYFIVFVSTLLIEPQINPIKHFPVVTVSHKLILPMGPMLIKQLTPYIGKAEANILVLSTIWLIPGVFGFLVWELKENWRLYAANRSALLQPQSIGHHGETMVGLLRPSFHSGTLPKLFARLRRATRKARNTDDWKPVNRQLSALSNVELALRRYIDREVLGPLRLVTPDESEHFQVREVRVATNRVESTLQWSGRPELQLTLVWEELDGRLTSRVTHDGLLACLPRSTAEALALSLTGLFQRTSVDAAQTEIGHLAEPPLSWDAWVQSWWPLEQSSSSMLA